MDIDRMKELTKFMKKTNDLHSSSIMLLGQVPPMDASMIIPTEIYELNDAIGIGGIPRGAIAEIYGPEGAGKTTISLHIIAQAQKSGGICAFIDAEHALNLSLANLIGVDVDSLVFLQPDNGEQALQIAREMIESGLFDVIIVDSVPALVPKAQLEKEIGDAQSHALLANMMSESLRVLTPIVKKSRTFLGFINQIREKPGVRFGSPEYTPGGRALKFFSSLRIEARKGMPIKDGKAQVGHILKIKVVKNKFAPPFKTAQIPLHYYTGLDKITGIIEMAIGWGIIDQASSMYYYKTETWDKMWHGKPLMIIEVTSNPELFNDIRDMLNEVVEEANKDGKIKNTNTSAENEQEQQN